MTSVDAGVFAQSTVGTGQPGVSGGQVSGGNITAEVSTGDGIAEGVSLGAPQQIKAVGGFIGQLFDAKSLEISTSPSTDVNEGDTRQLSAVATMDDDTLLVLDAVDLTWSVVNGPISAIGLDGLATADSPVFADTPATVRGTFDGLEGDLILTVINLLLPNGTPDDGAKLTARGFEITWDAVAGATAYRVYLGTDQTAVENANQASPEFLGETTGTMLTPSLLAMGTTYFWRIDTFEGMDVTKGDTRSFMTQLFQPDMRTGKKVSPAKHKGNNLHNLSGAGQAVRLKLIGRRKGRVFFSLENDGDVQDDILTRGSRSDRKVRLKYFQLTGGRQNVTSAITRAGHSLVEVDPAELTLFRMDAKATSTAKRARKSVKVIGTSKSDSRGADAAKAKAKSMPRK